MNGKIFIQANNKQYAGALIAKYAFERFFAAGDRPEIVLMNVDDNPLFKQFVGKRYLRAGREIVYNDKDLQSFTLSRFLPPQLMGYTGRALVIDPDVFALCDVRPFMFQDMEGASIIACKKKQGHDTSMMVLDCAQLKHWRLEQIFDDLASLKVDYLDWMMLLKEKAIKEVPRIWNSLDVLTPETRILHTTERLTQPWKTGLKIDFTRNPMPKMFGVIPREWIMKLRGKYPSHYQKHVDPKIDRFFFDLMRDALSAGYLTRDLVESEVKRQNLRPDILRCIQPA